MAEVAVKKAETVKDPLAPVQKKAPKTVVVEEKIMVVPQPEQKPPKRPDESKALAPLEKAPETAPKKISGGSVDRDIALAEVQKEKRLALIKAWEDAEKAKAENKAQKKQWTITAWENSKKAVLEAELKKIKENFEKEMAEYAEKVKNKIALFHKQAEEKRAMVAAKRGEEFLKAEEIAAKYRATGQMPKSPSCGCF